MKRILYIFAAALLLLLSGASGTSAAQDGTYDIFNPISKYISRADVGSLSVWLDDNVEIIINGHASVCSRSQACRILTSFFKTASPTSFSIRHKVSQANTKSAIGVLEAGAATYTVNIFIFYKGEGSENGLKIQMLSINSVK